MTPETQLPEVLFANEIGIVFSDNDCQIHFCVQGEPRSIQSRIGMTHRTAKVLYKSLERLLGDFEKAVGAQIPYDSDRLEELFQGAVKNAISDPTASQPPSGQSPTSSPDS